MNRIQAELSSSVVIQVTIVASGPQGPRGEMGERGPKGDKGDPGEVLAVAATDDGRGNVEILNVRQIANAENDYF